MSAAAPTFSIVVPTYNRPERVAQCVRACAALDYPRDRYELILVDDGSQPPLDEAVLRAEAGDMRFTLLRQPNSGPAAARNTGAAAATGIYLALTDDDCAPFPAWLTRLAEALAAHPGAMIGGHTVNLLDDMFYSAAAQVFVDVVYNFYNRAPHDARFITSNNMALALADYHAAGGFDTTFAYAEDREFCDRWRFQGRRIVYAPAARIGHRHAMTLGKFARQQWNYGRGAFHYHRIRAQRKSGSLQTEMAFHAHWRNWLLYPLAQVRGPRAKLKMLFAISVWQAANAGGHLWHRARHLLARA